MTVERTQPASARESRPLIRVLLVGLVVAALPFVLLLRSAVYFHARRGFPGWLAAGAALLIVALVITVYAAWVSHHFTGRVRVGAAFRWVALPLVTLYGGYTLLTLSPAHAKTAEVRSYYRTLHPVLRAAVGTLALADRHLVITDLERRPEDYRAMGLATAEASLHFRQADGYVHALDLRTEGRAEWRNLLVRSYFAAMGFRVRRHVGTADHMHVALPARSR